ncbi:MAG: glycosyltransferase [Acidobacteria bacterium]|nr:glycosyltransferase [Acidobacteriota bacterium]
MPIRSVHITNYYHKDSGGISTAYNKLLEGANRHCRYVRLIVPGERDEVEEVGQFGRIYFVKAGYSPIFDKRYRILWPWRTYFLDQSPIKKILRDEKPDMIEIGEKYTLSLMAGLLRKGIMNVSSRRPMLVHFSCERMDDNVGAFISRGRIAKRLCQSYIRNYLFPMFDFHLTNSEYTSGELREAVAGDGRGGSLQNFCWRLLHAPKAAPAERIFVNQCGVDLETFTINRKSDQIREQICRENDVPASAKLLLYAGRISPEKNVRLLPAIIKQLSLTNAPDFRLLVAGAGPEQEKLAVECERSALGKARMLGHVNDLGRLADLFANCDAFVHPNPREPFGITPLEAMASGLPVAAPDSGGILSYANADNAWLCNPDPNSFASALQDLFENDARRNLRIRNALDTARNYDWAASVARLFKFYDEMFEEFIRSPETYHPATAPEGPDLSKRPISGP